MRIQLHARSLDGEPLPGAGPELSGSDAAAIVEAMRTQTPFTATLSPDAYMLGVLETVAPGTPLPTDPEAAAVAFLMQLAKHRWIAFLPETPWPAVTEDAPCADKPV